MNHIPIFYFGLLSVFNNLVIQWGNTGESRTAILPIAYTLWYKCVTSYPNTDSTNTTTWLSLQIVTTSLTSVTSGWNGVPEDFITIGI